MAETLTLKIITPDRVFYEGPAVFVEFTTTEGQVGIYPHHEPMTMLLYPGVLSIHLEDGSIRKAALHTGFAEVIDTEINVLAQLAEWPEEIDKNRAEESRIRAERAIREDGSNNRDELALRKAIARIDALK